jgi:ABC-type transport system involved in multi-copper enzyme maturation permease subunit
MRAASTRLSDTLFGRWAGTTGFATSPTLLSWAVAWGAPLLAGLFASDIFAGEDRHSTWKTILTRSCTRTRLFLGKAVAATLCVWFSFAVIRAFSVAQANLVGGLAEPAGEVVVQVLLIIADPGDVAVGAQQDARNIQYRSGIREVIDPV